jgi:hypothetical protein
MSIGTQGVIAPATTGLLLEGNAADIPAGTPAASAPTPARVDTVVRGKTTANPNAYHEAIAKFSGGSDGATRGQAASVADMSLTDNPRRMPCSRAGRHPWSPRKQLENKWAKDLDAGKTVNVKIDLTYPKGSQRPSTLIVKHTVDGVEQRSQEFANEAPRH